MKKIGIVLGLALCHFMHGITREGAMGADMPAAAQVVPAQELIILPGQNVLSPTAITGLIGITPPHAYDSALRAITDPEDLALFVGIKEHNAEKVKQALDNGASLTSTITKYQQPLTPLQYAFYELPMVMMESPEIQNAGQAIVLDIVNRLPKIEPADFIAAAGGGYLDIVKAMRPKVADINGVNEIGRTALMMASWMSEVPVVQYLLDQGAKADIVSKQNETALFFVLSPPDYSSESAQIATMLLDRGVPVSVDDVVRAVRAGDLALLKKMDPPHDALKTRSERYHVTPTDQAVMTAKSPEILTWLFEKDMSPNGTIGRGAHLLNEVSYLAYLIFNYFQSSQSGMNPERGEQILACIQTVLKYGAVLDEQAKTVAKGDKASIKAVFTGIDADEIAEVSPEQKAKIEQLLNKKSA